MKWYRFDKIVFSIILMFQILWGSSTQHWALYGENEDTFTGNLDMLVMYTCFLIGYYIFRKVFADNIDRIVSWWTSD